MSVLMTMIEVNYYTRSFAYVTSFWLLASSLFFLAIKTSYLFVQSHLLMITLGPRTTFSFCFVSVYSVPSSIQCLISRWIVHFPRFSAASMNDFIGCILRATLQNSLSLVFSVPSPLGHSGLSLLRSIRRIFLATHKLDSSFLAQPVSH